MKYLAILSFFAIQCFGDEPKTNQDKNPITNEIPAVVEIQPAVLPITLPAITISEEITPVIISEETPVIANIEKPVSSLETAPQISIETNNNVLPLEIIKTTESVAPEIASSAPAVEIAKVSLIANLDETYKEPTAEEMTSILQNVDEIYIKDMDSHGEYYSLLNTAKELSSTPFYQTTLKDIFAKFFQLREDFFQKIITICEKYPADAIAEKIKAETISLSSKEKTEMLSNFLALIAGGKLSDNNLYSENEFFENTMMTFTKFIIVSELCDKMKINEEKFVVFFVDNFFSNIIKICSHSNNEFLNRLTVTIKNEKSFEDFLDKIVLPETLSTLENPISSFEKELIEMSEAFGNDVGKLIGSFVPTSSFSSLIQNKAQ